MRIEIRMIRLLPTQYIQNGLKNGCVKTDEHVSTKIFQT